MRPTSPEPTLEELLADPLVQLVMMSDNVVADDVRRIIHEAHGALQRRELLVERCSAGCTTPSTSELATKVNRLPTCPNQLAPLQKSLADENLNPSRYAFDVLWNFCGVPKRTRNCAENAARLLPERR